MGDTEEEKEKKDDSDDEGGKKKKKDKEVEDEAFDDSEDDDRQDREVDYMSDESSAGESSEEEKADAKGVDMDEGLSKMLGSDESSEDEDKDKDKDKEKEGDDEDETGKKKKKSGGSGANSDEEEGSKSKKGNANNSRSGTPTKDLEKTDKAEKRKAMVANILDPNEQPAKKSRLEQFGSAGQSGNVAGNETISEEAVRRYLKRRPMTTTDLLKKFRSKKTGIQNAQLVQLLANILKKINPHKHKVKGVTYLSLKEEK